MVYHGPIYILLRLIIESFTADAEAYYPGFLRYLSRFMIPFFK